jgi:TAG lipase/lysophosphatidylethanolamine acyltransferase
MCKDSNGNVVPWKAAAAVDFKHWTHVSYKDQESPLLRVAELFNVNHFIVSQARPYLIPFLQSDMHGPIMQTQSRFSQAATFAARMAGLEVRHRLRQLDTLGLLPLSIRRFLVDERVPSASLTLVPNVSVNDFPRLMETPTKETVDYWILKGERSVWPAVSALKVRCGIEMELDRAYQEVRRLKAGGLRRKASDIALWGASVQSSLKGKEKEKEPEPPRERQMERMPKGERAQSIGAV